MKKLIAGLIILTCCIINQTVAQSVSGGAYGNYCKGAQTYECLDLAIASKPDPNAQSFSATYTSSQGLVVTILKDDLKPEIKKLFSGGHFTLNQNAQLQDRLCNALGVKRGSKIPHGAYRTSELGKSYVVYFGVIESTDDTSKKKTVTFKKSDEDSKMKDKTSQNTKMKIGNAEHKNDWPQK